MRGSSSIGLWSRTDLRARWLALVVLGVLAGLTAGLAVAAFDGAERTGTALRRLETRNNSSDASVFPAQTTTARPDFTRLATRPEVEAIAPWRLIFGLVGGSYTVMFGPTDGVWLQQVDRPIVVEGRMFDPTKPNEMVVTEEPASNPAAADISKLGVGDVVHLEAFGPFDPAVGDIPGSGPVVDLTVVGIIHSSLSYEFTGGGFVSPAFFEKYGEQIEFAENAEVKLRHGAADVRALRGHTSTDLFPGVPVLDLRVTGRRVTATTDVEKAMLELLAAIIAIAGLIFVGQAIARSAATVGVDASTLQSLGMSRRDLAMAALRPHFVTAAVAAVVTVTTASIASRWFPVGLAAQVDPDRGVRVNVALVAAGAVLVVLLVVLEVAVSSWLAVAPRSRVSGSKVSRLARLGSIRPLPVGVGVRMALESNRRSGRSASRSALIGAVAAVAGIVAIVTIDHSLDDSLSHPEVAGVAWDATVTPNADDVTATGPSTSVIDSVLAHPGLAATSTIGRVVVQIGDVGVPTFTLIDRGVGAHLQLVTLSGHGPNTDGEVELGPSTARDLGVGIGGTIRLADGNDAKVVGLGLFPSDVHAQFDEGAWVSNARWFNLLGPGNPSEQGVEFAVAVRFADRSRVDRQIAVLGDAMGASVSSVKAVELPAEYTNLHNVRRVPTVLAAFLTVLGIFAVGFALYTCVSHRRKNFAVMRALGMTRLGSRAMLAAQGSTVAIVGLVIGVPIGLIAGRAGWRAITDRVPLTFRSPVAVAAILVVVPLAILAANALAVLPGHRAAKLDPAIVLRSE